MRVFSRASLEWRGDCLGVRGDRRAPSVALVEDGTYPGMFRVQLPDGELTDMVNRTRARDAAKLILLGILNRRKTGPVAAPMRLNGAEAA
jgi:hypothetical protein